MASQFGLLRDIKMFLVLKKKTENLSVWYTLFNITYMLSSTGLKSGEFEGNSCLLALGGLDVAV